MKRLFLLPAVVWMIIGIPAFASNEQKSIGFIENRGQLDPAVRYSASGAHGVIRDRPELGS
ncbi:MAG: hypothetical protein KAW17_13755 [Candidatus Eisenbacteria sp.]|nr:hypothetical protein [Candidatus Eisenbacteria bacterium]